MSEDPDAAEMLRGLMGEAGLKTAIDWRSNVADFIKRCIEARGIPMFRTRYASRRYVQNLVLGVCWGAGPSMRGQWFKDVPQEDLEYMETHTGDWRYLWHKYGRGELALTPEARMLWAAKRIPRLAKGSNPDGKDYEKFHEWYTKRYGGTSEDTFTFYHSLLAKYSADERKFLEGLDFRGKEVWRDISEEKEHLGIFEVDQFGNEILVQYAPTRKEAEEYLNGIIAREFKTYGRQIRKYTIKPLKEGSSSGEALPFRVGDIVQTPRGVGKVVGANPYIVTVFGKDFGEIIFGVEAIKKV